MSATPIASLTRAFRRTALPLGCYYAVTLGLPLANGAGHAGSAFAGHAFVVLVLPPTLIVLACAVRAAVLGMLAHHEAVDATPRASVRPDTTTRRRRLARVQPRRA